MSHTTPSQSNIHSADSGMHSLCGLFRQHVGCEPELLSPLPAAGSDRRYYRMSAKGQTTIGSYNPDQKENLVFLYLSGHFASKGFAVPQVYCANPTQGTCLLQDLGDETLLARIDTIRHQPDFEAQLFELFTKVISDLIRFQLEGDAGLDYHQLQHPEFDSESMQWDLNYFKYCFLKPTGIAFDEYRLESDFRQLTGFLSGESLQGFMYRDFQARNIMLQNHSLYYIDYQGGRRGPLQYDLVSLLFQARAAIPDHTRDKLIELYLELLSQRVTFDTASFLRRLKGFALLRLLQVMGAYGYRGWFERKPHFLESLPMLKPNLHWILKHQPDLPEMPEVLRIIQQILQKMENNEFNPTRKLMVSINSFSYRRGIPYDASGHGGGFVFDCRLLPNPGLLDVYKPLTGRDEEVALFLEGEPDVHSFVESVNQIVQQAVINYLKAGYTNLQLNFGCTGGRHRSVFCAEKIARLLKANDLVEIRLNHQELASGEI